MNQQLKIARPTPAVLIDTALAGSLFLLRGTLKPSPGNLCCLPVLP